MLNPMTHKLKTKDILENYLEGIKPQTFAPQKYLLNPSSLKSLIKKITIFEAAYPAQLDPKKPLSKKKILKIVGRILLFPWGIAWLAKKVACLAILAIAKAFVGDIMSKLILPGLVTFAKTSPMYKPLHEHKQKFLANPNNQSTPLIVKAADGVKIDGCIVWNDKEDFLHENFTNKKWVHMYCGNDTAYEQILLHAKKFSENNDCNVVLHNPRGMMDSEGYPKTTRELVLDGDAIQQYLMANGVKEEDIVNHGHSMGGALAAQVGALHVKSHAGNERSFSTIGKFIAGQITKRILGQTNVGNKPTACKRFIAKAVGNAIGTIVTAVLKEGKLNVDATKAWKKIQGHKWILKGTEDELMKCQGNLYDDLKQNAKGYKKVYKNPDQIIKNEKIKASLNCLKMQGIGHNDELPPEAAHFISGQLKQAFTATPAA